MMPSNQPPQKPGTSTAAAPAKEFTVRMPRTTNKKYSIMKFGTSNNLDFTKCGQAALARENNLKEYKQANDIDQQPKFGAGSEYGRDRRDEARKKKYGIQLKKYNIDEQPWLLKSGKGKEARKYKGHKEGGILENASYYIFTQCPDGAFEATPVKEWYNFNPVINYKYLNSEEAEEEFSRRDKTLNYFSIMLKKRLKNEDDADAEADGTETKSKKKTGRKKKDFMLTDMDEWAMLSDEEQSDGDDESGEEEKEKKPKKPPPKKKSKKKKKQHRNSDDEAMEESDDMDEGQEVDYMTDTDSEDDDMYNANVREKQDKYEEKGVEDEEGLRKGLGSDEEEDEEEKKEQEQEDKVEKEKADSDESDSDSSSTSDSDVEKDGNFTSALFMPKKEKTGRGTPTSKKGDGVKKSNSRTPTPTASAADKGDSQNGKKRKGEGRDSPMVKKIKTESPVTNLPESKPDVTDSKSSSSASTVSPSETAKNTFQPIQSEGISEEAVRRYLVRKPMTTKDLLQKFKSKKTGLSNEQLVNTIVSILKRINPQKQNIDGKMHLYLKPE